MNPQFSAVVAPPQVEFFLAMVIASTVVVFVAIIASHFLRRRSAAQRFSVWQAAFLGLLVLPIAGSALPRANFEWSMAPNLMSAPNSNQGERPSFTTAVPDDLFSPALANDDREFQFGPGNFSDGRAESRYPIATPPPSLIASLFSRIRSPHWGSGLLITWAIVAIGLLIRIGRSHIQARIIRRRAIRFECPKALALHEILDAGQDTPILVSADISTPETMGIINPCILLPPDAANWKTSRLRMVLKHEFAHIQRRDVAWQLMAAIVRTMYWFQPLAWIAERKMQLERERACDDCVIRQQETASEYAMILLEVAADMQDRKICLKGLLSMAQQPIEKRLTTILEPSTQREASNFPFRAAIASLFFGTVLIVSILRPFGEPPASATHPGPETNRQLDQHQEPASDPVHDPQTAEVASTSDNTPAGRSNRSHESNTSRRSGDELLERAIAGITQNYANIKTAQLTIENLVINPHVTKREVKKSKNASWTVAPVFIYRSNITLRGDEFRYDMSTRDDDEWNFVETKIRNADTWTDYRLTDERVLIRPTQGIGSFFPIDPRDFGGEDQRRPLLVQLKNAKALKILANDVTGDSPIVRVLTENINGSSQGPRREYSFDSSKNFLPISVVTLNDDGTVGYVIEIGYQEVIPGKSWFFRDMTIKFFRDGPSSADSEDWHQLITQRVVGKIKINKTLPDDAFTMEYPAGTQIFDSIKDKIDRVGGKPQ